MIPIPVTVGRVPIRTTTACAIAMAGGALVLLQAYLLPFSFAGSMTGLGVGTLILVFAAMARSVGRYRPVLGGATLLLGIASLLTVNGFYLGATLAIFGGLLIVAAPSYSFRRTSPASGPSSFHLGAPCPRCGKPVPPWTSTCPYCSDPGTSSP